MSDKAEPELRFPEFSEKWKLTPISALLNEADNRKVQKPDFKYTELGIRSHGKGFIIRENTSPNKNVMTHLFEVKKSDISINISFAWEGAVALARPEHEGGLVSHRFPLFQANPKLADPNYLHQRFKLSDFTYRLELYSPGGAGRNRVLKKSDLLKSKIHAPSLSEQQKIVAFLAAIDEKISAVEAQLTNWKAFKRGTMQAIFSQSLRFKYNDGSDYPAWKAVKLEDRFSFHRTNSFSRAVLGLEADGVANIHYGDIHTKYRAQFDVRHEKTGVIPNHLSDKAGEPLKKGDVIFADASEDYNDVGKAIEVISLDNRKVVAGLHTIVARPKKDTIASGFAAYLFASWPLRRQLMRIANGASVLGISKANLAKVDLTLPSLPEQQKIADTLSALDAKIEALTDRLDATREFKRGLLQKMFV